MIINKTKSRCDATSLVLYLFYQYLSPVRQRKMHSVHARLQDRSHTMSQPKSPPMSAGGMGTAHCQHLLIGASCHLPIRGGQLELGHELRFFLVELDRPRCSQIMVHTSGICS
jgi:thiamine phosphate synthase YjbQ (UPF0047 family)